MCFCSRVLKTIKTCFFSAKEIEYSKNILEKIQKQRTGLFSSRICTKSIHCPRILKTFRIWTFLRKIDRSLKKNVLKLSKTINFASFFFKYVSNFAVGHVFWRRSKIWVFWEKRCFFSKQYLKVFKNTKHGYFPSECFPKVIVAQAISKSSKLVFFLQKKIKC